MEKTFFVASHFLALSLFAFLCWTIGYSMFSSTSLKAFKSHSLEQGLMLTLGMGVLIVIFQLISVFGYLNKYILLAILFVGLVIGLIQLSKIENFKSNFLRRYIQLSNTEKFAVLILLLVALPTIFQPLRPPGGWDALMYHLPHAKQWALSGQLTVNEWIRYPWFPYNFELLYASSMIVFDDVMPQMIHALAGWLIAFMVFKTGQKYFNFYVATLAAIIWISLFRYDHGASYHRADIDMGLALFIFTAFIAFSLWLEGRSKAWLFLSAFFMGLALGTKYQALLFLPPFFILLLVSKDGRSKFPIFLLFFLIPCIYWYLRNFIITGDPVNPVGGKIFGFYDWNLDDYKSQFSNLDKVKDWPSFALLAFPIFLLFNNCRNESFKYFSFIFAVYSFVVWLVFSQYPRYLLPVAPVLAILSASVFYKLISQIYSLEFVKDLLKNKFLIGKTLLIFVAVSLAIDGAVRAGSALRKVAPNDEKRHGYLLENYPYSYEVLSYMNKNMKGKTYQFGLEDRIYYSDNEIWGDAFGPGRYRDFRELSAQDLHLRFTDLGFKNLLINNERISPKAKKDSEFYCYFSLVYEAGAIQLFKINDNNNCY